jgi:hypothetical protein
MVNDITLAPEVDEKEEAKKREEAEKKREKEAREKWEKEPAQGPYGRIVKAGKEGENFTEQGVYAGPGGPVAVPCSRGEQKAENGDKIVKTTIFGATPEEDVEIIYVIPVEVVGLGSGTDTEEPPVTNLEYNKFKEDVDKKRREKRVKIQGGEDMLPETPSKPRPTQLPATGNPAPKR